MPIPRTKVTKGERENNGKRRINFEREFRSDKRDREFAYFLTGSRFVKRNESASLSIPGINEQAK